MQDRWSGTTLAVKDKLKEQQKAFFRAAFETECSCSENVETEVTEDQLREMEEKLLPLVHFIDAAVHKALSKNEWEATLGSYYGRGKRRGLCNVIPRMPVKGSQYNDQLHPGLHKAFEEWARKHFDNKRMCLQDDEHFEGADHSLILTWEPETE